ncbi:hypothetical protein VTN77DRAFT_7633 [Rasamsonia byssochlamydoides]|uniref:uncharacterized protein n=1 Tax=Rasamsonia byssochlamydoides TaxID=89139 RepID=UPI003743E24B
MADRYGRERTAPFYSIPPRQIISVEHPGVVKNVDRAIATLHGNDGIAKILNPPKPDTPANLSLRPEDPLSRPLQSTCSPSNNILLRVTVPKWTGRKRKRGSDEPFTGPAEPAAERRDAKTRLRTLRDNVGKYTIEPVGRVERTHVFRGIPDIVFSTVSSPFTQKFREHILPFDFEKMKGFDISMRKGEVRNVDIIPPPSFSHGDVPFQYTYRQNPTVKQSVDTSGKVTTINTQQASKVLTHLVPYDIPVVPSKPRENCPPIPTLDKTLQETIAALEALFSERLAWTRRGLRNSLKTNEQRYCLRHAIAYVGYIFRSGPWRDAIVKLGHDPRTSPNYRIYQTFVFRVLPREPELARDGGGGRRHTLPRSSETVSDPSKEGTSNSHLFTGKPPLPLDGKIWMVCDIVDPILRGILFPENPPPNFLRSTCDWISDGWYGNGTLAKAKTIIRNKIHAMTQQNRVPDDAEFMRILSFPDHAAADDNLAAFHLDPETATSREMQLATEVRATIKGAPSWKGVVAGDRTRNQRAAPTIGTTAVDEVGAPDNTAVVKEGRWEDEDEAARRLVEEEEESEGEEEAIEREEIAAAVAAEVEAQAQQQARPKLDGAVDEEMEEAEDEEEEEEEEEDELDAENEEDLEGEGEEDDEDDDV